MVFVNVDGVDIYFERVGSGDVIVLTHGAWSDGRTWSAVVPLLADHYEVVTWDRRGHSRSGGSQAPGSVEQDASDLAAVIEALGVDGVYAVGSSAGGAVVLNLVSLRPDLVAGAFVHEPGPLALVEGDPERGAAIAADKRSIAEVNAMIRSGRHSEAAEFFIDEVAVGSGAWAQFPDAFKQVLVANAETVSDDLRDAWDVASVDPDAVERSGVPVMISCGTVSPVLEMSAARELSSRILSAEMVTLEGAGHTPYRSHPDAYVGAIMEFVGACSG